jgi:hypothetical protein
MAYGRTTTVARLDSLRGLAELVAADPDMLTRRPRWTWAACTGDRYAPTGYHDGDDMPRGDRDIRAEVDELAVSEAFGLTAKVAGVPRFAWHRVQGAGGLTRVRVTAVWWGRFDVARRWGTTVDTVRDAWAELYDMGLIAGETWRDDHAYRAFAMLGRA